MQCCASATGKLLKNALQSFSLFFGIKVCFVWMLMFICPKLNCPQVLFLFVSLLYSSFFFSFLAQVIFFSLCFTCVETTTPFLSVLFFPSSSSLTQSRHVLSQRKSNKQNETMEVLTLLTCALLCVVCCFSPLSLSSTHTLPNLDTGQVGGVYHSMMSLMDSVLSVMDSWDCRKKDECCAQCSCLVCRNPQLF